MDTAYWNALFSENVIEELVAQNVQNFCIAPGSRSSALTLAAKRNPLTKIHTHFDERGLAYIALGLAKTLKEPVALIVTSGSALANLLPAVIEAFQARVPLILLTADRPPELHQAMANQTIEQYDFFSPFIRFHFQFPPPSSDIPESFIRSMVAHAVFTGKQEDGGPIHLNCQFRTPLVHQKVRERPILKPKTTFKTVERCLHQKEAVEIQKELLCYERGVIVVGEIDNLQTRPLIELAKHLAWPLILDPLSNCRKHSSNKYILQNYENILDELKPDVVLKFGDRFVCKHIDPWLNTIQRVIYVSPHSERCDPEHAITHRIMMQPSQFIHDLIQYTPSRLFSAYTKNCHELSEICQNSIDKALFEEPQISEIAFIRLLSKSESHFNLFIGNSMPIRHVDRVFYPEEFRGLLFANRGHSGIEGNIATAIGISLKKERTTVAIIGDMTFWHDLNSLFFLKKNPLPLVFIVFNNGGGQIFSYLEGLQSLPEKEELFEMPHTLDYKKVAETFGLEYHQFDPDVCIESLIRKKRPILVEVVTHQKHDLSHINRLKSTLEWTLKESLTLLYK
ncbi:MAG: 2-succinyl-5-enolpyruvyl-6-hydroxy-3-cyclohexene-1-carboxylic-acid synthase [Chlamydiia bacterium]